MRSRGLHRARERPTSASRATSDSGRRGLDEFRDDALYPRVVRAVAALLERGNVVAPVDVLVGMGMLAPEEIEDWRRGRVGYLEQAAKGSLSRLSRLLRILRFH